MHVTKRKKPHWKDYILMIPTIWHSGNDKTMDTVKRSLVARGVLGIGINGRILRQ